MHDLVGQYCDDDLLKPKTTTSVGRWAPKTKTKISTTTVTLLLFLLQKTLLMIIK